MNIGLIGDKILLVVIAFALFAKLGLLCSAEETVDESKL